MKHRITEMRRALGQSQAELAVCLGATLSMVGKLERGERKLTMDWLDRIAKCLDVAPSDLIDLEDEPVYVGVVGSNGKVEVIDIDETVSSFTSDDAGDRSLSVTNSRVISVDHPANVVIPSGGRIVYDSDFRKPTSAHIGRLCVLFATEGGGRGRSSSGMYVGTPMPGGSLGRFSVIPLFGTPMTDVQIESVAAIRRIEMPD